MSTSKSERRTFREATYVSEREENLPHFLDVTDMNSLARRKIQDREAALLLREFKCLERQCADGFLLKNLSLAEGDISRWRFQLDSSCFDTSCPGGKTLAEDLEKLKASHGTDNILVEVSFPHGEWPVFAPLVRVVRPRCVWYTGHVTAGGGICLPTLVTGIENGWNSSISLATIVELVKWAMIHCDTTLIETVNGQQLAGPLRIDLDETYSYDVLSEYSEYAALAAFDRAVVHHRVHGW